jgi:aspartyl-tRNA(Asn)/glutamyl-tRNA(Gln) amidotransferase subunit A
LRGLRFALPKHSDAGAHIVDLPFAELEELPSLNAKGGFSAAESYAKLRKFIATESERIDPRVLARIVRGAEISGPDYVDLVAARASLIARAAEATAPFDAVLMPTVAFTAPAISALAADEDYARTNLASAQSLGGQLYRPLRSRSRATSQGEAGGFSLMGEHLGDRRLISIGLSCEAALRRE